MHNIPACVATEKCSIVRWCTEKELMEDSGLFIVREAISKAVFQPPNHIAHSHSLRSLIGHECYITSPTGVYFGRFGKLCSAHSVTGYEPLHDIGLGKRAILRLSGLY